MRTIRFELAAPFGACVVGRGGARRAVALAIVGLLGSMAACSGGEEAESYPAATCTDTCEKAIALGCPNELPTVEACVSECEAQIAGCADEGIVGNYLGCVAATPMVCGETTGTASSPDCVSEGLAYFACLQGVDLSDVGGGSDASDAGGGSDVATEGTVPPPQTPSVASGEIAFALRDGETTYGPVSCAIGSDGTTFRYNALPDGMMPGFSGALMMICGENVDESNRTMVSLSVMLPSLSAGSYGVATFDESGSLTQNSLMTIAIVDGQGGNLPATANGGITFEGTLTLTAASEGGRSAGTFTATWPRSARVVDGISQNVADVPGSVAIAFDGTSN